jgi:hypothetical protein
MLIPREIGVSTCITKPSNIFKIYILFLKYISNKANIKR